MNSVVRDFQEALKLRKPLKLDKIIALDKHIDSLIAKGYHVYVKVYKHLKNEPIILYDTPDEKMLIAFNLDNGWALKIQNPIIREFVFESVARFEFFSMQWIATLEKLIVKQPLITYEVKVSSDYSDVCLVSKITNTRYKDICNYRQLAGLKEIILESKISVKS